MPTRGSKDIPCFLEINDPLTKTLGSTHDGSNSHFCRPDESSAEDIISKMIDLTPNELDSVLSFCFNNL